MVPALRRDVAGLDPLLPLANIRSLASLVDASIVGRRFTMVVFLVVCRRRCHAFRDWRLQCARVPGQPADEGNWLTAGDRRIAVRRGLALRPRRHGPDGGWTDRRIGRRAGGGPMDSVAPVRCHARRPDDLRGCRVCIDRGGSACDIRTRATSGECRPNRRVEDRLAQSPRPARHRSYFVGTSRFSSSTQCCTTMMLAGTAVPSTPPSLSIRNR